MEGSHAPKQLIVEGRDDLFAIVGLMRAHVDWPDGPARAPVFIHTGNGAEEILRKEGFLAVFLKSPALKIGGVVLDADFGGAANRYESIRNVCISLFPDMPKSLPPGGLIAENADQKRFGVWIMPDNSSDGSLETFLKWLVPTPGEASWAHAEDSVARALQMGCSCRESHIEKANLYTWLAWQDPPGQNPGVALTKKCLDPYSVRGESFVAWFVNLYELPPRASLFN